MGPVTIIVAASLAVDSFDQPFRATSEPFTSRNHGSSSCTQLLLLALASGSYALSRFFERLGVLKLFTEAVRLQPGPPRVPFTTERNI